MQKTWNIRHYHGFLEQKKRANFVKTVINRLAVIWEKLKSLSIICISSNIDWQMEDIIMAWLKSKITCIYCHVNLILWPWLKSKLWGKYLSLWFTSPRKPLYINPSNREYRGKELSGFNFNQNWWVRKCMSNTLSCEIIIAHYKLLLSPHFNHRSKYGMRLRSAVHCKKEHPLYQSFQLLKR